MDNDSGWATQEITLAARAEHGHRHHLTLTCRWVELVQAWDGQADAYFLVSGIEAESIPDQPWEFIAFKDALGKSHRFRVGEVKQIDPGSIRLMRAD